MDRRIEPASAKRLAKRGRMMADRLRRRLTIRLVRGLVCVVTMNAAGAAEWPPQDPVDGQATVALDATWASRLRDIHDFRELQRKAGALGRIISTETQSETPRVIYAWDGRDGRGRMRAFVYPDGSFAVVISPAELGGEIVVNTFGGFVCPACTPPVHACGHRPSWVPHDLHWDEFDCHHTLTGPQGLYDRDAF